MKITLNSKYHATVDNNFLGYVGENNSRTITIENYQLDKADLYKLRLSYPSGIQYDIDISEGEVNTTVSMLWQAGNVNAQIIALKHDGNVYEYVKKSNIFNLEIKDSLEGQPAVIPTYEQTIETLEKVLSVDVEAQKCIDSANAAKESEVNAKISENNASKSANTAIEASDTANSAANMASNASDVATEKAISAENSATVAQNAQVAAETARDTAVSAQADVTAKAQTVATSAAQVAKDKQTVQAVADSIPTEYRDLSASVDELKGDLSDYDNFFQIEQGDNLINPDTVLENTKVNYLDGSLASASDRFTTARIPVDQTMQLKSTSFFNSNVYMYGDIGYLGYYATLNVNTPCSLIDGTTHVRVSVSNDQRETTMLYQNEKNLTYEKYARRSKCVRKVIEIFASDTEDEIYNKMKDAIDEKNCDVIFELGTYSFDSIFDTMKSKYRFNTAFELPLGGNCRYYFNGSTIKGTYTGTDSEVGNNASVLGSRRKSGSYELYDGIIEATDIIYCVHDEASGHEEPYVRKYHNMRMKYISGNKYTNSISKCIGGGTGLHGLIAIENCVFESDNSIDVSYHGVQTENIAESNIIVSNCYLSHTFGCHSLGTNERVNLNFCGNSVSGSVPVNIDSWTVKAWNNEVRTN